MELLTLGDPSKLTFEPTEAVPALAERSTDSLFSHNSRHRQSLEFSKDCCLCTIKNKLHILFDGDFSLKNISLVIILRREH